MVRKGTVRYEALENYLLETINEEKIAIEAEEDANKTGLLIVEHFTADLIALLDGYVRESQLFGRAYGQEELGN